MSHYIKALDQHLDQIVDDLVEKGFVILDDLYSMESFKHFANECLNHELQFREAGIQNGVMPSIRSDHILWIDDTDQSLPYAKLHLLTLSHLSALLNQALYLGLRSIESHFARYDAGDFYALHRDNPQQKNQRIISTVFYLHSAWHPTWGGELHLQDKQNNWHLIEALPNRMVIFDSNLLHEVKVTQATRLSLTAWLRADSF